MIDSDVLFEPVSLSGLSDLPLSFVMLFLLLLASSLVINFRDKFKSITWRPASKLGVLDLVFFFLSCFAGLTVSYASYGVLHELSKFSFFTATVIATVSFQVMLAASTLVFLKVRTNFSGFPVSSSGKMHEFLRGIYIYLRYYPLIVLMFFLNLILIYFLNLDDAVPASLVFLSRATSPSKIASVFLLVVVFAPLVEEIAFRGYFYPALRRQRGHLISAVICALVFATFHFEPQFILSYFAIGYFLCLAYEESGSIIAPVSLHAFHNFISLLYFYAWV